jgi:hypothetical protein
MSSLSCVTERPKKHGCPPPNAYMPRSKPQGHVENVTGSANCAMNKVLLHALRLCLRYIKFGCS